jgi:hypothetical protein
MKRYSKTLVAVAGWIALLGQSLAGNGIDAAEAGALVTGALIVFGVYQAPYQQAPPNATGSRRGFRYRPGV